MYMWDQHSWWGCFVLGSQKVHESALDGIVSGLWKTKTRKMYNKWNAQELTWIKEKKKQQLVVPNGIKPVASVQIIRRRRSDYNVHTSQNNPVWVLYTGIFVWKMMCSTCNTKSSYPGLHLFFPCEVNISGLCGGLCGSLCGVIRCGLCGGLCGVIRCGLCGRWLCPQATPLAQFW